MHLIILYSMDYTLGNKITENSCICFVKLKNWEHEKKKYTKINWMKLGTDVSIQDEYSSSCS